MWTCCGKHVSETPCEGQENHHVAEDPDNQMIKQRWQFHGTPGRIQSSHRLAVAIDCEMGTAFDGESELIRLSLIDYFTGNTLIDSLVYPDIAMQHDKTRWSGVKRTDMVKSRREGRCIIGKAAARAALFRYVGPSTIVVGHGAQNDLASLRWIHNQIVDNFIIVSSRRREAKKVEEERQMREGDKAKGGEQNRSEKLGKRHPDGNSLKALAMGRLGRAIQVGKGHDSLEDAVAARDLVHSHIVSM